jgi:hypothetical protein
MVPLAITQNGNLYSVKIEMSGTFAGSPVQALFVFKIMKGKIAELDIN